MVKADRAADGFAYLTTPEAVLDYVGEHFGERALEAFRALVETTPNDEPGAVQVASD